MASNDASPKEEEKKDETKQPTDKPEEKKEPVSDPKSAGKSTKIPENMISVDPDSAYFNPGGGTSTHMLVNTSDRRMAVKIRSSNNDLYRVCPVVMFIESGQCQQLAVTRLAGPARADKLVIQYTPCGLEDKDAKEFFSKLAKDVKCETLRINLKMADQKPKKYTSMEVAE